MDKIVQCKLMSVNQFHEKYQAKVGNTAYILLKISKHMAILSNPQRESSYLISYFGRSGRNSMIIIIMYIIFLLLL